MHVFNGNMYKQDTFPVNPRMLWIGWQQVERIPLLRSLLLRVRCYRDLLATKTFNHYFRNHTVTNFNCLKKTANKLKIVSLLLSTEKKVYFSSWKSTTIIYFKHVQNSLTKYLVSIPGNLQLNLQGQTNHWYRYKQPMQRQRKEVQQLCVLRQKKQFKYV